MTNLVIDAPALVEVSTVDPDEIPALAERVCGAEWLSAPSLVDYEVLDVLRTLVARGDIDHELAASARQVFDDLRLIRYPLTDDAADRVWQLRHNASAYDAAYVALAESLGAPLVTAERRLAVGVEGPTSAAIESYATTS